MLPYPKFTRWLKKGIHNRWTGIRPLARKYIDYCQGTLWIKIFKLYVASEIL